MKPFRPQVFLFRLLAGIFIWEGILLAWSFQMCSNPSTRQETILLTERCPRLGQRAETIFELAIATTLSLLAGGTQFNLRSSSSGDRDALALPLPQPPSPPLPEENPHLPRGKAQASARGKAPESAQESVPESE